ncbi:MAG: class I SAM-dependent methyltransferase [Planctomycetota bacterium]|nr:class I SAM-dependent methyltransferase [Planctomycetota bacterium]
MTHDIALVKNRTMTPDLVAQDCRVCGSKTVIAFAEVDSLSYWRCTHCQATLLADSHLPAAHTERARYEAHQNDPADLDYQQFLSRLAMPLIARLTPTRIGLDYGCGPTPAMAMILERAGHRMRSWDPFFRPDDSVFEETYDFITCSEVIEHFHRPRFEFDRMNQLLRPGGWLALMTSLQTDDERFSTWYYRRDPTHVTFYKERTLRVVASAHGWDCEFPVVNVCLMCKKTAIGQWC